MLTDTRPASPKQLEFARDLYREVRDLINEIPPDANDARGSYAVAFADLAVDAENAKRDRAAMSTVIDAFIEMRDALRKTRPGAEDARDATAHATPVPAGRYAISTSDGVLFYHVDRPTEGKWAGYVFVNRLHGSPGDLRREPVRNRGTRDHVLLEIAVDPGTASRLFGVELGTCGVCGSPLTNDESRELGIGPVCREKTGW